MYVCMREREEERGRERKREREREERGRESMSYRERVCGIRFGCAKNVN
jgi:hypothetical protein